MSSDNLSQRLDDENAKLIAASERRVEIQKGLAAVETAHGKNSLAYHQALGPLRALDEEVLRINQTISAIRNELAIFSG